MKRALLMILVVSALSAPSVMANPASADLVAQGQLALTANKPAEALDLFETASLADPASVAAYAGMARSYDALGLPGKALRYYREALELAPNDVSLLEAQALGMIAKGNMTKAQVALDRVRKICAKSGCVAITRIDAAMAKARTQTSMNTVRAPAAKAAAPVRKANTPR